jgi:Flp pilus assembly protein TadG
VATLELALAMIFLVPLLAGMLDFGYYFYVASNTEEAARAGVREVSLAGSGNCAATGFPIPDPRAIPVQLTASSTGAGCNATGGDAACYMNQPPLLLGGATNITVSADCLNTTTVPAGPSNPTWRVTVTVDFPLAYGFLKAMFPASTRVGCTNCVKYTATAYSTP